MNKRQRREFKSHVKGYSMLAVIIVAVLSILLVRSAYAKNTTYYVRDVDASVAQITQGVNAAKKGDNILLMISSHGGLASETWPLLNAIKRTKGKVTTVCDGTAASAGAVILVSGHKVVISEYCMIHFHLARYTKDSLIGGETVVILPPHHPTNLLYMKSLIASGGSAMLTEEEVQAILAGQDVSMTGEVFVKRMNKVKNDKNSFDYLKKAYLEIIKSKDSYIKDPSKS